MSATPTTWAEVPAATARRPAARLRRRSKDQHRLYRTDPGILPAVSASPSAPPAPACAPRRCRGSPSAWQSGRARQGLAQSADAFASDMLGMWVRQLCNVAQLCKAGRVGQGKRAASRQSWPRQADIERRQPVFARCRRAGPPGSRTGATDIWAALSTVCPLPRISSTGDNPPLRGIALARHCRWWRWWR
jgi:hypothetical protein